MRNLGFLIYISQNTPFQKYILYPKQGRHHLSRRVFHPLQSPHSSGLLFITLIAEGEGDRVPQIKFQCPAIVRVSEVEVVWKRGF